MNDLSTFVEAAIRTATPLLLAAIGEAVSERAGAINISLEGSIIAGAFAAFAMGATTSVGYAGAVGAGVAVGALFAAFTAWMGRDQIVVGTALTMLALGVTGTLFRARDAAAGVLVETDAAMRVPVLAAIPVVGPGLFNQPLITYIAFALVPVVWWVLYRTHAGLAVRAVGEAPAAARAAGVNVPAVQGVAILFGAAMGGLAGGALVLAQAGTFAEGMSAGRGFLAIAIVALGRWRPAGVAGAALVFGAAMALQFVVQALGWNLRYELVLMLPYLLTLIALGAFGRGTAPAMLARSLRDS